MYVCFSALDSDAINSCHYSRQRPKRVFLHPVCVCVAQYVCRTACYTYDSIFRPSTTGGSSRLEEMETDWDVRDGTPMPRESISSVSDKRHRRAVGLFQPSSDVTDNQSDICCLHPLDHWRLMERREGDPPPPRKTREENWQQKRGNEKRPFQTKRNVSEWEEPSFLIWFNHRWRQWRGAIWSQNNGCLKENTILEVSWHNRCAQ